MEQQVCARTVLGIYINGESVLTPPYFVVNSSWGKGGKNHFLISSSSLIRKL